MGRLYQYQVARYSKSAIWLPDFKSGVSALGCSDKAGNLSGPLNSSLVLHPGNSLPGWVMVTIAYGRESSREKASEPRNCLL
jgi:hypothetical protein